jgi:hypothetical protein
VIDGTDGDAAFRRMALDEQKDVVRKADELAEDVLRLMIEKDEAVC